MQTDWANLFEASLRRTLAAQRIRYIHFLTTFS